MLNPYNSTGTTTINECITSKLYVNAQERISQLLCLKGLPFFYHFATNKSETRFASTNQMPYPEMDGHVRAPSRYAFTGSGMNSTPCMFVYRDWGDIAWDKRICGSTDNHLTRPNERIRAFVGDLLQSRVLLENMCCDTSYVNQSLPEMLNGIFDGLMNSLVNIVTKQLITAIFAPVIEKTDAGVVTKTFTDDTTEIDLTGNVSITAIIGKLAGIVNTMTCAQEYYWFVPQEYYSVLAALTSTTACCSFLSIATVDMNGSPTSLGYGLQFSTMPFIKIFALPKENFPVNGAGKIVTALLPKGSIAWTLMAPTTLNMPSSGGVMPMDIMSLSQYAYESDPNNIGKIMGSAAIKMMVANPQAALNYNGEIAAFTALVTGRLPGNLYRVLVEAAPVPAPAPPALFSAEPTLFDAPIDAAPLAVSAKSSKSAS